MKRNHSTTSGRFLHRPLLVAMVVFGVALAGTAALISRMESHRLQYERARVFELADDHAKDLQRRLDRAFSAAYALAALVRQGDGVITDFEAVADEMLDFYPGVAALQLAPGGIIRAVVPLEGNEGAIGHHILGDPARAPEARLAVESGQLTVAGPFGLKQGGVGAVARLPVFLDDDRKFWGFIIVLVRFPEVLDDTLLSQLPERGFVYELWHLRPDAGEKQIIASSSTVPLEEAVDCSFPVPNGTWTLSLTPAAGWGDPAGTSLRWVLGFSFSLLLAWLAKLTAELKVREGRLEGMVAERTAEIRASEERLRLLEDNLPDSYIYQYFQKEDGAPRFLYVSAGMERLHGLSRGEVLGDSSALHRQIDPEQRPALAAAEAASARDLTDFRMEVRIACADGQRRWLQLNSRPRRREDGRIVWDGVATDISERKRHEEQLEHLATHDDLTGLANRALLLDRLDRALQYARRSGRLVAVLLLDLDRFKIINDSLGHSFGDKLLCAVARRLGEMVREADTVARLGGDEFVLILGELKEPEDVRRVADKILQRLCEPLAIDDREIVLTASLGISLYPTDSDDGSILIRNADMAMYRAKRNDRSTFAFYSPEMGRRILETLEMEGALRKALEQGEFRLHYQPKVDLAAGRITGCEALVRWRHPQRGTIRPDGFIPLAEETGLIVPLGAWVLREACRQARAWKDEGFAGMSVAVNLSASQFRRGDLPRLVNDVLRQADLDPALLELELTESMVMNDPQEAQQTLLDLKALGVGLSLDDFGTGYSSLNYLRRFPFDTLKIDRSFIQDVAVDPSGASVVTSVVAIGKNLGLKVVAEGVETPEQLSFLSACGCDMYQGYLFSRPLPVEDLTGMLRENGLEVELRSTEVDRPESAGA